MDDFNEIELSKLLDEATFVILMAYDHHKRAKILMDNGRKKTAFEHVKIVLQNAERLQATITKVIEGLEESHESFGQDWIFQKSKTDELIGKY
jgi:uncharacterized protein (DUF1786 family)